MTKKIETKLAVLETEIGYVKQGLKDLKDDSNKQFDELKGIFKGVEEKFDKKYAPKSTEKVAYTTLGIVVTIFTLVGTVLLMG